MPIGRPKTRKLGETTSIMCPDCDGTGKNEAGDTCLTCNGTGFVQAKVVDQRARVR